jgi:hypothetical protein
MESEYNNPDIWAEADDESKLAAKLCQLHAVDREGEKRWRPESFALLKLENSTLNPDGTRDVYFARVDPNCKTAEEAWFSLHRLTTKAGKPLVET